jgi:hypothetical protein
MNRSMVYETLTKGKFCIIAGRPSFISGDADIPVPQQQKKAKSTTPKNPVTKIFPLSSQSPQQLTQLQMS